MDDKYPGNSRSAKQKAAVPPRTDPVEKKMEKVVSGKVVQRKRSLAKRFHDTFIGGDSRSVGEYIVMDVLVPGAKTIIHDVVTSYVDRMLFPDSRGIPPRRHGGLSSNNSRINYAGASSTSIRRDPRDDGRSRHISSAGRARHDFGEVALESRVEAQEVLDRMYDQARDYGSVSVADLYDMLDITSEFTDNKWGWYNLDGARIRPSRGEYVLDLPRPVDFDR